MNSSSFFVENTLKINEHAHTLTHCVWIDGLDSLKMPPKLISIVWHSFIEIKVLEHAFEIIFGANSMESNIYFVPDFLCQFSEAKHNNFSVFFLVFALFRCSSINFREPLESQRRVAMISEMIHTASLIHDDVIDQSDSRRGKQSINVIWNHRKVCTDRWFYWFGEIIFMKDK